MRLRTHWRMLGAVIGATALSSGILLIHLGNLTNGLSQREIALNQQTSALSQIAQNPVGLPLHLLQWLVGLLPMQSAFWLRLPSVVLALMAIAAITYVMRRWYGPRTASFGFFLIVSSAWLLHVGRLATDDVLYVWAIAVLLASHVVLHNYSQARLTAFFWLMCNLAILYVPGMIWFVLLNTILQRHELAESLQGIKSWLGKLLFMLLSLILLSPLAYGLLVGTTRTVGLDLLGLPHNMPAVSSLLVQLKEALLFVFIRGHAPDDVWLNHLPMFGALMTVALLAGLLFYGQHWHAGRTRVLAAYLLVGFLLVVAGGKVTLGVVVPLLYVIAAAGIAYLLHLWLVVFPRNPLARGFGITLVSLVVAAACIYNLRQYFVAWPHHPETIAAFQQRKIEPSRR